MQLSVQAMRDIVARCLVKDANKRPTAAQLLEHKFFKVRGGAPALLPVLQLHLCQHTRSCRLRSAAPGIAAQRCKLPPSCWSCVMGTTSSASSGYRLLSA